MLHGLASNDELCDILIQLLNTHLQHPDHRDDLGCWDKLVVPVLPKCPGATHASSFRGITRIPLLKKLVLRYFIMLLQLADEEFPQTNTSFGFKKGTQTHDIIFLVHAVIHLRRPTEPTYIVKVDVVIAFDKVLRSSLIRSMERRKLDPMVRQHVLHN